ncbi:MAG: hypothetical protein KatS3mg066_4107 [Fischerella sp.]|nr:MAG: hypothetical protein KatS3mg066_4107 [Fischerella sp.]
MNNKFLYLLTAIITVVPTIAAQAAQVELGVFKSVDAPEKNCPQKVVVTEQNAPYYEGGYTVNGQAKLGSFAGPFAIASSDLFSVTWVANLKPAYRQCVAGGGIVKYDNEDYNSSSHLRIRFHGGKVFLILDMTGKRDANNFTPIITKKGVSNGNPTWSWSGTD